MLGSKACFTTESLYINTAYRVLIRQHHRRKLQHCIFPSGGRGFQLSRFTILRYVSIKMHYLTSKQDKRNSSNKMNVIVKGLNAS